MRKILAVLVLMVAGLTSVFAKEYRTTFTHYDVVYDNAEEQPCVKFFDIDNDVLYFINVNNASKAMEIYYEASQNSKYIVEFLKIHEDKMETVDYMEMGETGRITKLVVIDLTDLKVSKMSYEPFNGDPVTNTDVPVRVIDKSDPSDALIAKTSKLYENVLDKAEELLNSESSK